MTSSTDTHNDARTEATPHTIGEEMATTEETITQLQDEIKGLEVGQAVQGATLAGAQATQAAAHAGTWSTMLSGAAGLVVGMFLAVFLTNTGRR